MIQVLSTSGVGVLESGSTFSRPVLENFKYSGKTDVYNLPFFTAPDVNISATEETRLVKITENSIVGITRAHSTSANHGVVTFRGVFTDKSNHGLNNLIATVSGIGAYANNTYIGELNDEYAWSGLNHLSSNYLWISMVEDKDSLPIRSSRQFREFETRSTTTLDKPLGPENSVLVATYNSGVGFNLDPWGKNQFVFIGDHLVDNQNPHGDRLLQDYIVSSGIEVLGPNLWDSSVGSGLFLRNGNGSGLQFWDVTYYGDLSIIGSFQFVSSGIMGNIHSGSITNTLFSTITDMEVDPATIGTLVISSGLNFSGSPLFRGNMLVNDSYTVDGIQMSDMIQLIDGSCLSGNSPIHWHFLNASGTSTYIEPRYPGLSLFPRSSEGLDSTNNFEFNTDMGFIKPTMRHKNRGSSANAYIRQYVPHGYNVLNSIEIDNIIDPGFDCSIQVRDCAGTAYIPHVGKNLTSRTTSGVTFVSGIPQSGFSHNFPWDIELTFGSKSGSSCYMGRVKSNYLAVNN